MRGHWPGAATFGCGAVAVADRVHRRGLSASWSPRPCVPSRSQAFGFSRQGTRRGIPGPRRVRRVLREAGRAKCKSESLRFRAVSGRVTLASERNRAYSFSESSSASTARPPLLGLSSQFHTTPVSAFEHPVQRPRHSFRRPGCSYQPSHRRRQRPDRRCRDFIAQYGDCIVRVSDRGTGASPASPE